MPRKVITCHPKGAESRRASRPQVGPLPSNKEQSSSKLLLYNLGSNPPRNASHGGMVWDSRVAAGQLDKQRADGRLVKLPGARAKAAFLVLVGPGVDAIRGGSRERPILENSTACTMSNAKNPFGVGGWPFSGLVSFSDGFLWNIDINNKASQSGFTGLVCSCQFQTCAVSTYSGCSVR